MHNRYFLHYIKTAIFLVTYLILTGISPALEIRSYDENRHLRILNFPSNPRHNSNFIYSSQDFSGVGWITSDSRRQLAMVSPKHFIGAHHFRPAIGSTLRFLSKNNIIKDFTIATTTNVPNADGSPSDLFIGTLNEAISQGDNISFHPYLNLDSESDYINQELIVFGRFARGGRGSVNGIHNAPNSTINRSRALNFQYLASGENGDDCFFQSGDSGSPTFIQHNGVASIVGTNSLISRNLSGNSLNFANFIPSYIDEINAIMENEGYRMTKAISIPNTLALTQEDPNPTARVGHSTTLHINLENIGYNTENETLPNTSSQEAENIRLFTEFPSNVNITNISGTSWFAEPSQENNTSNCRRAQLSHGENSQLSITFTPNSTGLQHYTITVSSDQSEPISHTLSFQVMPSFLHWADGLTDVTATGDDDQDGISNLLEYAFGGDPTTASQITANGEASLLPVFTRGENSCSVAFVRRVDHAELAIDYQVTSSNTLSGDNFLDASSLITGTDITPINDELELVTHTMQSSGPVRLFRVEITLTE